jgi:hypothetical protein
MKSSAETEPPRRAKFLKESEEAMDTNSNTDKFDPKRATERKLKELPRRMVSTKETCMFCRVLPKMDTCDPKRTKLRILVVEPILTKSKIDNELPTLANERKLKELPKPV